MNGIDCSVWAPRESNVPDFHRVMSLFDIYSGITGLISKGEYDSPFLFNVLHNIELCSLKVTQYVLRKYHCL